MSYSRRTLSLVTILLLLAALAAGAWWRLGRTGEASASQTASDGSDTIPLPDAAGATLFSTDVPQPVEGAEVVRDTLWIRVRASGQAEAFRRTAITNQVAGLVDIVHVRENRQVSAGTLLAQIDTTEYALALATARANLLSAQAQYRQDMLFADEISDPEVRAERERIIRARSGLDQSEVSVRTAEIELARTRVSAPFEGRIANLEVVAGQYVGAGTELMTVVDLDPIKVEVQVLEAELGVLREGRRAQVNFAAFPGETFVGRVETINPVLDPELRTGRVTIHLPNPDHRIKPGMYADISLDAEALPDRVIVPRSALLERGDDFRDMLYVFNPVQGGDGSTGVAEWRYVNPGRESDTHVELVREGPEQGFVEPGEIVLVNGHHYLAHDTRVRLVESVAASGGGRPVR